MVDQTSQFYAILTQVGAAKQANADALGIPWKITQMAVGDGNPGGLENPPLPMPSASATALLNEWRRAPLNQLKVDDKDNSIIVAEQVIPADVGGRWIREVALFDADGDMVAVANCAPTYKPLLSQGSGRTQVVRMNLIVSSSSNVQLKIDPSVVLATREWVTEELAKQDFKHSALVATTAAITLSGLQTVDGVALSAGARVLVKNQAAGKDNGLYLVVAGGAWTRCADVDTSAKVTPGMLVPVEKGTINADSTWQLVTDGPITLGVTTLAFEMAFGRTGVAAGTYRSVTVDAYGRVVAATNPTTVVGYGLTDVYTMVQVNASLALKANLASPALTGVPTAPTAAVGTNTAQLANTAFVQAAVAALVASSPGALDTLNELAAALGNDPNFATTMTNLLALKAPLASPALTGLPTAPTAPLGTNNQQLANTAFVQAQIEDSLPTFISSDDTTDWNTITARGWFKNILSGPKTPNGPGPAAPYWYCQVLKYNVNCTQVAYPYGTAGTPGLIAHRSLYQGIWSAWSLVYSTSSVSAVINQLMAATSQAAALAVLGAAPLASPAFTGMPTAPTPPAGTNTAQVATAAFVQSAIAALVASSPAALDTLNELAAALGNDPNYAATVTNALALKAPLASPTFTGAPKAPTPAQFDASPLVATMAAVQRALGNASDFEELTANRLIAAADAGKTFMLAAPDLVVTFPDSTTLPKGFEVTILAAGSTSCSLAGSTFISSRGGFVTGVKSYSLKVHARKSLNQYRVSHWGDGSSFAGVNGWLEFAGGIIVQWGLANSSTSGVTTTLPIAFPNTAFRAVATPINVAIAAGSVIAKETITVTSASGTPGCAYIAIGN